MGDHLSKKIAEKHVNVWSKPQLSFPAIALDTILNLETAKQLYGLDIKNFDYCIGVNLGEYIAGCVLNDFPIGKTLKMLSYFGECA